MKRIRIAELKSRVSDAEPLRVRKPLRRVRSLQDVALPPPLKLDLDAVALLLEERRIERIDARP